MIGELLILTLPVAAIALFKANRDYRERGRLSPVGLLLLCLMLFLPNLALDYATRYHWPSSPLETAGALLAAAGLALCFAGIGGFRSIAKVFGLDPGRLTTGGLYRRSRNPQYLGWLLFLLGFSLTDWSPWCAAVLLVVGTCLHLLVRIEERHLLRRFGKEYADYCREVPRYLGPRRAAP